MAVRLGIKIVDVGLGVVVCSDVHDRRGNTTIKINDRFLARLRRLLIFYSLLEDEVLQNFLTSPWHLFIITIHLILRCAV